MQLNTSAWNRCTNWKYHGITSSRKYLPDHVYIIFHQVSIMAKNLRTSLEKIIADTDWMDEKTRQRAQEKVKKKRVRIRILSHTLRHHTMGIPLRFTDFFARGIHRSLMDPWWRHQTETFPMSLALCEGNPPVTGGFPSQRPLKWSFAFFYGVRLNKPLSKQSRCRWIERSWRSLWRHGNVPHKSSSSRADFLCYLLLLLARSSY